MALDLTREAGDGRRSPGMAVDGRRWPEMAKNGLGSLHGSWGWPGMVEMAGNGPRSHQVWPGDGWDGPCGMDRSGHTKYLEPDGLYASDLKRGALALRDFLSTYLNVLKYINN